LTFESSIPYNLRMVLRHEQQPKSEIEATPFIPYSEGLQQALALAKKEAVRRVDFYLSTGDLLLGLSQEETAKKALGNFGLTAERIRSNMPVSVRKGNQLPEEWQIRLSETTEIAMELANAEAIRTGAKKVTPIHAVIGIILGVSGFARGVIEELSPKDPKDILIKLRKTSS